MTTDPQPITVPQCRAARALLGWSADELAKRSIVGVATVRRFEGGTDIADGRLAALREALEAGGVMFLGDGVRTVGGSGVRFRERAGAALAE